VVSESSVHIFIDAVNDAPRFVTSSSKLVIDYPAQSTVSLDIVEPVDPESTLSTVRVSELPELGEIKLDGAKLSVDQVLTFDQLERLEFTLDENVNGPIGSLTIQAIDGEGAATNWSLEFEVQGDSEFNSGTAGSDELYGSVSDDVLYGKGGNDTLVGNAGDDRLLGGLGNDTIIGGSGSDTLDGSAGNDFIDGGSGADFMTGGPGSDTYVIDEAGDVALEVISGGSGGKDLIITSIEIAAPDNIENLQASAGVAINLTGNELDNILLGNELDNELTGLEGRDSLFGENGKDILDGGPGVDLLSGGAGDDTYHVSSKSDRVNETVGQGTDHVFASSSFTLPSNVENLTLEEGGNYTAGGNSLDNHLVGNSDNNILAGGIGADILEGGLGNDIYVLSDLFDTIIDTGGRDTVRSNLDITLLSDIENADLVGIGDTSAIGNGLSNELSGNMADNILDGAGGVDTLTGGDGSDTFVIASNGSGLEADTITDFTPGEDLIVLDLASFGVSAEDLGLLSSGLVSADAFVTGAGARPLDLNDHFIFDTAQGLFQFDIDGSGDEEAVAVANIDFETEELSLSSGDVFVGI
jgi:Ca2+-binding RTX toxin-like protein